MKKEARCFWKQHPQLSLPPHSGPDQILRGQTVLGTSPGTARSSLPLLGAVAAAGWHADRLCCHRAGTLSAFLHCGATTSQAFLATPRLLSAARLPEPAEGQMWGLIKLKKKKKKTLRGFLTVMAPVSLAVRGCWGALLFLTSLFHAHPADVPGGGAEPRVTTATPGPATDTSGEM